jgi:hypothetical protein
MAHSKFGRQVEAAIKVTEGGENNEYKGTTFKTWLSFGKDKETGEEYIAYGGPLYQMLSLVASNLDDVLENEDLSEREYEKFIKKAVRELDDLEIVARVGVKTANSDESKKSNFLIPATFGPEDEFEELDLGESA